MILLIHDPWTIHLVCKPLKCGSDQQLVVILLHNDTKRKSQNVPVLKNQSLAERVNYYYS